MKKIDLRLTIKDIVLIGVMIATLEAGKFVLSFLPNIEIVSLLIVLYTIIFGKKIFYAVFVFVLVECLVWGFGLWSIMYFYIWPLLALISYFFRNQKSVWFWSIILAIYGLIFGALCSIVYFFAGGISGAISWWIAGIPYDIVHCFGNFSVTLVLYKPLSKILIKLKNKY